MTSYDYHKPGADVGRLATEITAAGLPLAAEAGVMGPDAADNVRVTTTRALTPSEKTTLDNVVAAHDGRPRRLRPLWAIRADVQALSAAQWTNVWNDLSAAAPPVPRKYLSDYGVNAGPIFVFDWSLYVTGPTAAQQKAGQISLVAMYCQDRPNYLVNPPFAPLVSIPGDEPAS